MPTWPDERESSVAQQGEVLRPAGLVADAAVFTPNRGSLAPVVLVFRRPVVAADGGEPGVAGIAFAKGGDGVGSLAPEVPGVGFLTVIRGDAHELSCSGEESGGGVEVTDAQLAPLDSTVAGLFVGGPISGAFVKHFPRQHFPR